MLLTKINVLIVDDDNDSRDLLAYQLKGEEFIIHSCESGEEALELLEESPQSYDIVLMDQNMPGGISGIDAIKKIRANEKYGHVPVVLQTSDTRPSLITDSLAAGAFYFLEKSSERSIIKAVVHSAMRNNIRFKEVVKDRSKLQSGLGYVEEARFRIRTLEDMNIMTMLLSTAFPDPDAVTVGIHELLTNAIEHGNLGITYDDKSKLVIEDNWQTEVERRLGLDENKDKTVEIQLQKTPDNIELTITDQGKGFRPDDFMEIDPCRLFDPHGRGIAVAKSMSFDDVVYYGCGNQVKAIVKL